MTNDNIFFDNSNDKFGKPNESGPFDLNFVLGDPLFLHPNDTSGNPIISFKLTGTDNYNMWNYVMKFALRNKNKLGFIDGTCKRDSNSPAMANKWDMCSYVVVTWILGSLSPELYAGQIYSKTALDMWNDLKETYDKVDGSRALSFCETAFVVVSGEEYHRSIASMGTSPKPFATALVDKSFDNKKKFNKGFNSNNMGLNLNLKCTNCDKTRHTVERCFDLIRYPPNYKKPGNQNSNKYTVNNAFSAPSPSIARTVCFSNEQMLKLLSLINDKSSSSSIANMAGTFFNGSVVDSDANQHMTASAKFLINVVNVSNLVLTVGHPNGTKAKIVKIGDLKLNEYVTLFNALVIPEYTINLLSVHRLSKDSKFFVGFDENKCYIQDLKRNMIVGTGDINGGLYLFDATFKQSISKLPANCYVSKTLWHNRIGHPTDQVLQLLKDDLKFDLKNESMTPCDMCHKAKQTREPFPLSDHESLQIGQLVYLDVWGPYKVTRKEGYKSFLTIIDDYSRAVWVYMLKSKDEVFVSIEHFVNLLLNQFDVKVKVLRSDNGTEFVNNKMQSFCKDKGIIHQTSMTYTPNKIGLQKENTDIS
ncbi:ribonuclease H-like domain-containing protein [Tanacetum coccineum]|uniref:Ribonuclease H-like domain-containing protein n=1 Tax=Tanacetum coccineum TaxID=301880 RepID=A0ABQ5CDK2_9ASTR